MKQTLIVTLLLIASSAIAQKATIDDVNKSMVKTTFSLSGDTINYLSVPGEMLTRLKTENDYGGQYDVKGLELQSTIATIQKTDLPTLSRGNFLQGQRIEATDSTYFKYPKEFNLNALKANIDKLEKNYPGLNVSGYKRIYEACKARLSRTKADNRKAIR